MLSFRPLPSGLWLPPSNHQPKEVIARIHYRDGTVETFTHKEYLWPFKTELNYPGEKEYISRIQSETGLSLLIGISAFVPTDRLTHHIKNGDQIRTSLEQVRSELDYFASQHPSWRISVAIVLNGENQNTIEERTKHIKDYLHEYWIGIPNEVAVIEMPMKGKNNAVNTIIEIARKFQCPITTFLDDDILFSKKVVSERVSFAKSLNLSDGVLVREVEELLKLNELGIVGPDIPPFYSTNNLWSKIKQIVSNGRKLSWPLMGNAVLYTESWPMIPNVDLQDDAFLATYFIDEKNQNPYHRLNVIRDLKVYAERPSLIKRDFVRTKRMAYNFEYQTMIFGKKWTRHFGRYHREFKETLMKSLATFSQPQSLKFLVAYCIMSLFWGIAKKIVTLELFIRKFIRKPLKDLWYSQKTTGRSSTDP